MKQIVDKPFILRRHFERFEQTNEEKGIESQVTDCIVFWKAMMRSAVHVGSHYEEVLKDRKWILFEFQASVMQQTLKHNLVAEHVLKISWRKFNSVFGLQFFYTAKL